jgi:hypothetical protein
MSHKYCRVVQRQKMCNIVFMQDAININEELLRKNYNYLYKENI